MISQKMTELLLRSAANPDDNVRRFALVDLRQQLAVFNCRAVTWREIKIDIGEGKLTGAQPACRLFTRRFVRKDPKDAARFVGKQPRAEMLEVFQARNARDFSAAQDSPKHHHRAAIGDREIGARHCFPIRGVASQPHKTCPGWRDQETALAKHERDGFIDITVEKPDSENLLRSGHQRECGRMEGHALSCPIQTPQTAVVAGVSPAQTNVQRSTSNAEHSNRYWRDDLRVVHEM